MTRILSTIALAPITIPAVGLSYAISAALAHWPNLDVTRTTDPIVAIMRATALEA